VNLQMPLKQMARLQMLPTPTAMDSTKDGDMKAAAKMMMGATHRASGQQLQKTLTDAVHIELLKGNSELAKELASQPMMKRTKLPPQKEFIKWIRQTNAKELSKQTNLPFTKVEHWFRTKIGFSHPSIEDWNIIKLHLKDWENWEHQMTFQENKEWKGMLPTPTTALTKHSDKEAYWNNRKEKGRQEDLAMVVHNSVGYNSQLNPEFVLEMMGFPSDYTLIPFNKPNHDTPNN